MLAAAGRACSASAQPRRPHACARIAAGPPAPAAPPAGGLNFQVEHHLFPTLPRHRLRAVAPAVAALCAKHGLAYEACGMAEGTRRVLACLAAVARLA